MLGQVGPKLAPRGLKDAFNFHINFKIDFSSILEGFVSDSGMVLRVMLVLKNDEKLMLMLRTENSENLHAVLARAQF